MMLSLAAPALADTTVPGGPKPGTERLDLSTWKLRWVAECVRSLEGAASALNSTGLFRAGRVTKHWGLNRSDSPMPAMHATGVTGNGASFDAEVDTYPNTSTSFAWLKNPPGSTGAPFPTTHWLRRDKGRSASFGSVRADPALDEQYRRTMQPALDLCFN
jgi:hypothetical protein